MLNDDVQLFHKNLIGRSQNIYIYSNILNDGAVLQIVLAYY